MLKSNGDSLGESFGVEGGERSEGEEGVENVDLSPSGEREKRSRREIEVSSSRIETRTRRRKEGRTYSEHSPRAATSFPATVMLSRRAISSLRSEISTRAATALATTVGFESARRSRRREMKEERSRV